MANLLSDVDVTLIIKAPNQKISDQTVKCEMEWTVKRLKQHLSEVYPNQPKENQQRIIYSGRLLHDHLTLKEILKKENETHTVHLVCPPEKNYSNQSSTSISNQSRSTSSAEQPKASNETPQVDLSALSEEELRRLYQEYYSYAYQLYHQQMLRSYMAGGSLPAVTSSAAPAPTSERPSTGPERPADPPAPPAAPPAAGPVQQAAMAAGPGGIGGEFDEENFERDWLDWFYYALRVAILIGLLNYYSSLSKILTTLGISCVFCLYRLLFQRRNRAEEAQPPRPAQPPAEEAPAQPPAAPEHAAQDNATEPTSTENDQPATSGANQTAVSNPQREAAPVQPVSVVRKLWNSFYLCTQFFVTLFTSLVPERIQPLDLN